MTKRLRWVVIGAGVGIWAKTRIDRSVRQGIHGVTERKPTALLVAEQAARKARRAVDEGIVAMRTRDAVLRHKLAGDPVIDVRSEKTQSSSDASPVFPRRPPSAF